MGEGPYRDVESKAPLVVAPRRDSRGGIALGLSVLGLFGTAYAAAYAGIWGAAIGCVATIGAAVTSIVRGRRTPDAELFASVPFEIVHDREDATRFGVRLHMIQARVTFANELDAAARDRLAAALPSGLVATLVDGTLVLTGELSRPDVSDLIDGWGRAAHADYAIRRFAIAWSDRSRAGDEDDEDEARWARRARRRRRRGQEVDS